MGFIHRALLSAQCGGLPGRGLEGAILLQQQFWLATSRVGLSAGPVFVDLTAAFYTASSSYAFLCLRRLLRWKKPRQTCQ
eukprot:1819285-Pyramimonas_sp.AAC.1